MRESKSHGAGTNAERSCSALTSLHPIYMPSRGKQAEQFDWSPPDL